MGQLDGTEPKCKNEGGGTNLMSPKGKQILTSPKSATNVPRNVQPEPSLALLRTKSSHPVTVCLGEEINPHVLVNTYR